ncbi:MAG: regulatory iron-sulfur-containing complex subunit RicT [Candidatus Gastranaerophilales bacterium]
MKFAVRYLKNKFYPLDVPQGVELCDGQMVLVRTEKGEEALKAFLVNSQVAEIWENCKCKQAPLQVIKVLSQRDLQTIEDLKKEEENAFFKCKSFIKNHKLNMNLIECKITFDKRKITFYYTAPERVDFRLLLKDLTQTFTRVRIDLRHIGIRDETALQQGCGICGRGFCCSGHLKKFPNINVKQAKDQGMPIAPCKISGTCGRLLCCLNYEYSNYIDAAKDMPPVGSSVMTPEGLGKVCFLQFVKGTVSVKMEDGKTKEFPKSEIDMVDADVNIEIDSPAINKYVEEADTAELKRLEDDKNSSTGNV